MIDKVVFKKPGAINTREFSYVDMHYHTVYSDGRTKITKAMKKCKKKGFGIAITDHNDIRGSILASRYKGVMVIPGIEVGVKEGSHLLLYFYNTKDLEEFYLKNIKDNRPRNPMRSLNIGINQVIEEAKAYNAITCAPHPFLGVTRTSICKAIRKGRISPEVMERIHLIEVINGLNMKKDDVKAAVLANRLRKGITAGSDGHTAVELGKALTYTDLVDSKEQFLEELVRKRSYVVGKQWNMAAKTMLRTVAVKKHMQHPVYWIKEGRRVIREKNNKMRERFRKGWP